MTTARSDRRRAGFSLIEVVLSAALLGLVLGSATMVVSSSQGTANDSVARAHASSVSRQTLERCARELSVAGLSTFAPDPAAAASGTAQLTFTPIIGAGAAAPVFDSPRMLRLVYTAADPNNGADDDNDGVVDNGQLELVLDVGTLNQHTVVLCKHVREYYAGEVFNGADDNGNGLIDERGFNVSRAGSLVTIRMCVEEPGRGGATFAEPMETSVDIRN